MRKMDYLWIVPVCLIIIGYFGIAWVINGSSISIDLSMDDQTLEATRSIIEIGVTPTCEEGCLYLVRNWIGSSFDEETEDCVEYCAEVQYNNEHRINEQFKEIFKE